MGLSKEYISHLSWAVTKISSLSQAAHLLSSLGSKKDCENEVTKPDSAPNAASKLQGPQEGQLQMEGCYLIGPGICCRGWRPWASAMRRSLDAQCVWGVFIPPTPREDNYTSPPLC